MNTPAIQAVSQVLQQVSADQTIFSLLKQYQLLPQLLQEVIIDQAIASVTYTPEEEAAVCQGFFAQYQVDTAEARQQWLDQRELSLEDVMVPLLRGLRIEKFKQITWGNRIESYFLKRKDQLDRVIYSMIQHQDSGTITELYFRLQEHEQSFVDLAPLYSQGLAAKTKGINGPVEFGQLHPNLAEALRRSHPQELVRTRIGDWYIIAQVESLVPAQLDKTMQQRLLNELFNEWLQQEVNQMNLAALYRKNR